MAKTSRRPTRRPPAPARSRSSQSARRERPGRRTEETSPLDLLLIVRDALASSLVGNLLLALDARARGSDVGVLVTQEALAALAFGTFEWPRQLSGQEMRFTLADRGAAAGVPVMGRGEGRQLDVKKLVATTREAGVALYACPTWTALLGLADNLDRLPPGVRPLDAAAASVLIRSARQVIGTL